MPQFAKAIVPLCNKLPALFEISLVPLNNNPKLPYFAVMVAPLCNEAASLCNSCPIL